jgi:hypothetical protein
MSSVGLSNAMEKLQHGDRIELRAAEGGGHCY